MRVVVLCDGGFKSTLVTVMAVKENGADHVRLMFLDQGQEAAPQQQEAVNKIAAYYNVPCACFKANEIIGSIFPLTNMLLSGLSYASHHQCERVMYGASKKMDKVFNYELTLTHLRNMQLMMKSARHEYKYANFPEPEAPLMLLNVLQIGMLYRGYDIPSKLGWNCNRGGDKECGECENCIQWAVASAGMRKHTFSPYKEKGKYV